MDTLGQRIKAARKARGITQVQIKNACGISSGNLSEIENDKVSPTSNALLALKRILNVSVDWLLTGEGSMFPEQESTEVNVHPPDDWTVDNLDAEQKELIYVFNHLSSAAKLEVKNYIAFKLQSDKGLNANLSSTQHAKPKNNKGDIA